MVLSAAAAEQAQRGRVAAGMRALVTWAATMPAEAIPEHVVRRAALVLADNIAALVAAQSEPEVERAQALFAARATIARGHDIQPHEGAGRPLCGRCREWHRRHVVRTR